MSAGERPDAIRSGADGTTDGRRGAGERANGRVGRAVVRLVFAVLFGYVLAQSVGNLVQVVQSVHAFNAFVTGTSGSELARSVPWPWLVVDVLVAPVAFAVAWLVSRRSTTRLVLAVFVVAFAASGVVWLDLQLYVPRLLDL